MHRKKLLWQIFPSYLIIILVSLIAVTWYSAVSLRDFHIGNTASDLEARAYLLEEQFVPLINSNDVDEIDKLCKELGHDSSTRITVILPDGTIAGDTKEVPGRMENHANRPEVQQALNDTVGESRRKSPTLQREMMYVAIPLKSDNEIIGVVRTSIPLVAISRALGGMYSRIIVSGFIIAVLAAAISLAISKRLAEPLEQMKHGAEAYAAGDFSVRLPVVQTEEIASLADSMNIMAGLLNERINTITMERNEREAVLSSMVEGVFAVDSDEHIISINIAAARMLEINMENIHGRSIHEVIRNTELQEFVKQALNAEGTIEDEIILRPKEIRYIRTHGTTLLDAGGSRLGAVVVLNDITRIRRLENLRRDFVANVSHELKTPITSIKGYVETLQQGAIKIPDDADRFLGVVARQAERLNRIVEDLLLLSRIEQDKGSPSIKIEKIPLCKIIEAAVDDCRAFSNDKNIEINMTCPKDIVAEINAPLLETAIVNLIDNAIKYSDTGSKILINTEAHVDEITISVTDHGLGVAAEHQPRLFERFYRVDKGRSREMGGTGLGLAIVKHIAEAHKGKVSVESKIGQGSTFRIHLPKPANYSNSTR